jgi:hypothetical protein
MCKLTPPLSAAMDGTNNQYKEPLFLTSLKSFQNPDGTRPSNKALIATGMLIIGFLCAAEQAMRYFFVCYQVRLVLDDEKKKDCGRHVSDDIGPSFDAKL